MGDKLNLRQLVSLENDTSATNSINLNSDDIEAAIDNTLSRDGTSPNTMGAEIDMNSNHVTNLPTPTDDQHAVNKAYVDARSLDPNVVDDVEAAAAAAAVSEANAATSEANAALSAQIASDAADSIIWEVRQVTFADSPVTVTSSDGGVLYAVDTSGGNVIINLPSIAVVGEPFNVSAKKKTGDTNTITWVPDGTDTVDISTQAAIGTVYQYADIDTTPDQWIGSESGAAAGNLSDEIFVDGVGFTAGVSNSITLANDYGSETNIWVEFDGVTQHSDQYSLSSTTLTFTEVIPATTKNIMVKGGSVLAIGVVGDGTVTEAKLATNAVTNDKMADDSVGSNEIIDGSVGLTELATEVTDKLGVNRGTAITMSGTSQDLTIPTGMTSIDVAISQIDTTGSSPYLIQFGHSGGIQTTAYSSNCYNQSGNTIDSSTEGFILSVTSSADGKYGLIRFTLVDENTNEWVCSGIHGLFGSGGRWNYGRVTLVGELTTIRLTTENGTDTFTDGVFNANSV